MKQILLVVIIFISNGSLLAEDKKDILPIWEEGYLDIHHINTGRGNAAFAIFPDGTLLLIDAGDMSDTHPRTRSARNAKRYPNQSKSTPEWIVDYIKQFSPPKNKPLQLDYALITHYHDDHFGEVDSLRSIASGNYQLTGIMEVGTLVPIEKLIDRGFDYPINLKNPKVQAQKKFSKDPYGMIPTLKEYWKFIQYQKKNNGMKNEAMKVGSDKQMSLKYNPNAYQDFSVLNIASSGKIFTGYQKNEYYTLIPNGEYPGENTLSNCIKITYGSFDYFTGGDISGIDKYGQTDFGSLESHIAPVVGAVDVSTLNHHGNRDSNNIYFVKTLRPRVWIQQNWSSDHPGDDVLRRITSEDLYPGKRDVFSTVMLQPNKDVIGPRLDKYKSQKGHIVLRVLPGGANYYIYVLDDSTETREIISKHGPYESR